MVETVELDIADPKWRTVKGAERNGVHVTVYSKLLYTFTDPLAVLGQYERGEIGLGAYAAQRPGELPGSTYITIQLLPQQESPCVAS